jgi:hypothetical protein
MSVYATSITVYKNRNHTVRVVVDTTDLGSIASAILKFSVRTGTISAGGAKVVYKTNSGPSTYTPPAVVSANTVEFYLLPADTVGLTAGDYTADATITTALGTFQLLEPLAFTLREPVTV